MRASGLFAAAAAAALLAAPALAQPAPPNPDGGAPPCPGAQPGEQVLSCVYVPFAPNPAHRGAYDAGFEYDQADSYASGWSDDGPVRDRRDARLQRYNEIDLDAF